MIFDIYMCLCETLSKVIVYVSQRFTDNRLPVKRCDTKEIFFDERSTQTPHLYPTSLGETVNDHQASTDQPPDEIMKIARHLAKRPEDLVTMRAVMGLSPYDALQVAALAQQLSSTHTPQETSSSASPQDDDQMQELQPASSQPQTEPEDDNPSDEDQDSASDDDTTPKPSRSKIQRLLDRVGDVIHRAVRG